MLFCFTADMESAFGHNIRYQSKNIQESCLFINYVFPQIWYNLCVSVKKWSHTWNVKHFEGLKNTRKTQYKYLLWANNNLLQLQKVIILKYFVGNIYVLNVAECTMGG